MTTDGGKTWQRTLFVDNGHGCADLEINPKNPNVLYAAMWRFERKAWNHTSGSEKSGVFRSTDGGRTWKKLEKGDYDWSHMAHDLWPDRIRAKCVKDRSLASLEHQRADKDHEPYCRT